MKNFLYFLMFILFSILGGFSIIKYEDDREIIIKKEINELSLKIDKILEEKKICDINLINCNENLIFCKNEKNKIIDSIFKK